MMPLFRHRRRGHPAAVHCRIIMDVATRRHGRRLIGDCPFCHTKDTFAVNPDVGLYYCFACSARGEIDMLGDT